MQVVQVFIQKLLTRAFLHGLLHIVAHCVRIQSISPENGGVHGLVHKVGLGSNHAAHEPAGILERHQGAAARDIAGKILNGL